jgi:hypothetical protein
MWTCVCVADACCWGVTSSNPARGVQVWSSALARNAMPLLPLVGCDRFGLARLCAAADFTQTDRVVRARPARSRLAFLWDQTACSRVSLPRRTKPLFMKEMSRVRPRRLRWWSMCLTMLDGRAQVWTSFPQLCVASVRARIVALRGADIAVPRARSEPTRTLLIDDSPEKATRNPSYTSLFAAAYQPGEADSCEGGRPGGGGSIPERVMQMTLCLCVCVSYALRAGLMDGGALRRVCTRGGSGAHRASAYHSRVQALGALSEWTGSVPDFVRRSRALQTELRPPPRGACAIIHASCCRSRTVRSCVHCLFLACGAVAAAWVLSDATALEHASVEFVEDSETGERFPVYK